jgi:hypothetical protein
MTGEGYPEVYRCPHGCTDPACECKDPACDLYWFGCHKRLSAEPDLGEVHECEDRQHLTMAAWLRAQGHRLSYWYQGVPYRQAAADLVGEKIFLGPSTGVCLAQAVEWSRSRSGSAHQSG